MNARAFIPLIVASAVCSFLSAATYAQVPAEARATRTAVYYTPFTVTNCWSPATTETIVRAYKGSDSSLLLSREEQTWLYQYLDQRGAKAKFNADDVRLFVPAQNNRPAYAVDSQGVVRFNRVSYTIKPVALLRLSYLLDPKLSARVEAYYKKRQAELPATQ